MALIFSAMLLLKNLKTLNKVLGILCLHQKLDLVKSTNWFQRKVDLNIFCKIGRTRCQTQYMHGTVTFVIEIDWFIFATGLLLLIQFLKMGNNFHKGLMKCEDKNWKTNLFFFLFFSFFLLLFLKTRFLMCDKTKLQYCVWF